MADRISATIEQHTAEEVAYKIMLQVLQNDEKPDWSRAGLLDLYADCLDATRGFRPSPAYQARSASRR